MCVQQEAAASCEGSDLEHGFGQQLGSEQLQHRLHDVLPALPQDVAVAMGQVKNRFGRRLRFGVTAENRGKVLHGLTGQQTPG